MEHHRVVDKAIYLLVAFVLFFSPLPYGSAEPTKKFFFLAVVFIIFLLWLIHNKMTEKMIDAGPSRDRLKLILLAVFVAVCILQILPMPGFALKLISSNSFEIWDESAKILGGIGLRLDRNFYTISLYPAQTWRELMLFLGYIAFGYVVSQHFRTTRAIMFLLVAVFAIAFIEAIIGIAQHLLTGSEMNTPNTTIARGTYVNKNHFAGFMEMTLPLAFGYSVSLWHWTREKSYSIRQIIVSDKFFRQLFFVFLLGLMFLALVLSRSRAALASILIAFGSFIVISAFLRRGSSFSGLGLLLVIAVGFILTAIVGVYPIIDNFVTAGGDVKGRILVWMDTLHMISDFPLFGAGFGSFSNVYPMYKEAMTLPKTFNFAHNDYLQMAAETGLAGLLSLMGILLLMMRDFVRKIIDAHSGIDHFRKYVAIGAMMGIISILVHSMADFNLHVPANGLYFAFLWGLVYACLHQDKSTDSPSHRKSRHPKEYPEQMPEQLAEPLPEQ